MSDGPAAIRTLAVTASDVVAALESRLRTGDPAVLRVTPPFSGRMRARLHVDRETSYEGSPRPVHVDPRALVLDAPAPPHPDEAVDEFRADAASSYDVEAHRQRHEAALAAWRDEVRDRIVDSVTLETSAGPVAVEVVILGPEPTDCGGTDGSGG